MVSGHTTCDGVRLFLDMYEPEQLRISSNGKSIAVPNSPGTTAQIYGTLDRNTDGTWRSNLRCLLRQPRTPPTTQPVPATLEPLLIEHALRWMRRKDAVRVTAQALHLSQAAHARTHQQRVQERLQQALQDAPAEQATQAHALTEQIIAAHQQAETLRMHAARLEAQLAQLCPQLGNDSADARRHTGMYSAHTAHAAQILQNPTVPLPDVPPAQLAPAVVGIDGVGLPAL